MSSSRRTEFAPFVMDLLDFIEEKIVEALRDEASQVAAIGEAAGAVAPLRDRLREDEFVLAQFMLVLGTKLEERHAGEWWLAFADMDRAEFENEAAGLVGPQGALAVLRDVTAAGAGASGQA